jgi:hypothetical protein
MGLVGEWGGQGQGVEVLLDLDRGIGAWNAGQGITTTRICISVIDLRGRVDCRFVSEKQADWHSEARILDRSRLVFSTAVPWGQPVVLSRGLRNSSGFEALRAALRAKASGE